MPKPSKHQSPQPESRPGAWRRWIPLAIALAAIGGAVVWLRTPRPATAPPSIITTRVDPKFVGGQSCVPCHERETKSWLGSHHEQAMKPAMPETVLGDFNDAKFTNFGLTSTFFRRDGRYFVNTDGPNGVLADFEIKYTFGVSPLQQYLVEFPGGRFQCLDIAWDSRPAAQGGQRWYHLHPEDAVPHGDVLHWTGPALNWNFMCAECHSTNLQKNFRPDTQTYETTWSEINVSCEACHGPAEHHITWARTPEQKRDADPLKGLLVDLRTRGWQWELNPGKPTVKRATPRTSFVELDVCGRCHARREVIAPYQHARPLSDTHRVSILDEGLYFADGQQQDEVYEYGSFLQSKMHASGVTCSDCHDVHSMRRPESPDSYCARCHQPDHFATPAHHHHEPNSAGASCVACHMPARTYMGVDARRDHSFRVPRPDLTLTIGTPNSCGDCHADKPTQWAADHVAQWRGPANPPPPHYGEAIHAGRTAAIDAAPRLSALAANPAHPAIVRATALSMLPSFLTPDDIQPYRSASADPSPLVRAATARALGSLPSNDSVRLLWLLLADPVKSVRLETTLSLIGLINAPLSPDQQSRLTKAIEEYRAAQLENQDRAEAQTNLGSLEARLGDVSKAEVHFERALTLNPRFIPPRINLADIHRLNHEDAKGEALIREGLKLEPASPDLKQALALALVRLGRSAEALEELKAAAELAPDDVAIAYTYGIALNSLGRPDDAIAVLERCHARRPAVREILAALATICRDAGNTDRAAEFARKLVALSPNDASAKSLLSELETPNR